MYQNDSAIYNLSAAERGNVTIAKLNAALEEKGEALRLETLDESFCDICDAEGYTAAMEIVDYNNAIVRRANEAIRKFDLQLEELESFEEPEEPEEG